jgi:hypothetical protein
VAVVVAVLMPVARIMVTATVVGGATVVAVRVARSRVGSRARAPVVAVVTVPTVAAQAALRRVELVVPGVVVVLPLVFDLLCPWLIKLVVVSSLLTPPGFADPPLLLQLGVEAVRTSVPRPD